MVMEGSSGAPLGRVSPGLAEPPVSRFLAGRVPAASLWPPEASASAPPPLPAHRSLGSPAPAPHPWATFSGLAPPGTPTPATSSRSIQGWGSHGEMGVFSKILPKDHFPPTPHTEAWLLSGLGRQGGVKARCGPVHFPAPGGPCTLYSLELPWLSI